MPSKIRANNSSGSEDEVIINNETSTSAPMGNTTPVPGVAEVAQPSYAVNLVSVDQKPIEIEILTSLEDIKLHFHKFFSKIGKGKYADFIDSNLREIVSMYFENWNEMQEGPSKVINPFGLATKEELKPFINYYWVDLHQGLGNTQRLGDDETKLRAQLCALKIHNFFDKASKRHRFQDLSHAHS
jgi:hypothetical protein